MNQTIRFRVKRKNDNCSERMLLKLKGVLIAEGFTEIIHIIDDSEDSYVNIFSTAPKDKKQAECFIEDFISAHGLKDTVTLLEPAKSWLAF